MGKNKQAIPHNGLIKWACITSETILYIWIHNGLTYSNFVIVKFTRYVTFLVYLEHLMRVRLVYI